MPDMGVITRTLGAVTLAVAGSWSCDEQRRHDRLPIVQWHRAVGVSGVRKDKFVDVRAVPTQKHMPGHLQTD